MLVDIEHNDEGEENTVEPLADVEEVRAATAGFDDNFVADNAAADGLVAAHMSMADMEASFAEIVAAAVSALERHSIIAHDASIVSVDVDYKSGDADYAKVSPVLVHSTPHAKDHSGAVANDDDIIRRRARIVRKLNRMHPPEQMVNGFSRSGFSRAAFK
jgi:hypothetical protein